MATSSVKWYGDDLLKQIRENTPEGLYAGGEMLLEAAKNRVPTGGTGDIANSGYVAIEGKSTYQSKKTNNKQAKVPKNGAVVGFADFRALFVEFGTKPHKIGKPGQPLRLPDGTFVRGPIQHPGAPAKPFFRPAYDELKEEIGNQIIFKIQRKLR